MKYDYDFVDIENQMIEKMNFWYDCVIEYEEQHNWNKNKVKKCSYSDNKKAVMDFLNSDKMSKSFEYDTMREARMHEIRFERVISRYHLKAKVKRNDKKITLIKSRLRG